MDNLDQLATPEQLARQFQLRHSLEQLVDKKFVSMDDVEEFKRLGFSSSLPGELMRNQSKLKEIIHRINTQLESWRQRYSKDIDAVLPYTPNLAGDFHNGIYSMLGQIYLMNPFNVVAMEQFYHLPVTGDRVSLMKNWNAAYYGRRCLVFNEPFVCLMKAVEHGDVTKFEEIYPTLRQELFTEDLVRLLTVAAQHGSVDIFAEVFADYMDRSDQDLVGYDFVEVPTTLAILKIMYSPESMLPTIPLALKAAADAGNKLNFAFLAAIAPPIPNNLFNIAGGASRNGWDDLTKAAIGKLERVTTPEHFEAYMVVLDEL